VHDESDEIRVLAIGKRPLPDLSHGILMCTEPSTSAERFDAVLVHLDSPDCLADVSTAELIKTWLGKAPVLVTVPCWPLVDSLRLIDWGVQDVLHSPNPEDLSRAVRFALARHRFQQAARLAYATDLSTGLPHQEQLLEYISQLIALRAREPAALVVIALRTEGWGHWSAQLGDEGARVLRRKLAVRLRAALRASDVVASIGSDMFGVLLGHVDSADDGFRVVAKLVAALQQPIVVSAQSLRVSVAAGLATWPEHGHDPLDLLRRATAQASSAAVLPSPPSEWKPSDRAAALAANDEPARR
jgi:diguanylate cyclase (GGDEF)-like protein